MNHELDKQSSKFRISAFEHHAKIMKELDAMGFKPNPVPQIGIERIDSICPQSWLSHWKL